MDGGVEALQQYLSLSRLSASSAANSVLKAVDDPHIFVFAELLDEPNVKALAGGERQAEFNLLQLFSHGTYAELKVEGTRLMKLKMLSLVTMAAGQKILPYADIQTALDLGGAEEVEALATESIYNHLINGKMDQRRSEFHVQHTIGRDTPPSHIDAMIAKLEAWQASATSALTSIDGHLAEASAKWDAYAKEADEFKSEVTAARLQAAKDTSGPGGAPADFDDFDDQRRMMMDARFAMGRPKRHAPSGRRG